MANSGGLEIYDFNNSYKKEANDITNLLIVGGSQGAKFFDQNLKTLSTGMLMTMYEERGVGLAAPQVNQPIRLIVMDISENRDQPMVFVNPVVSSYAGRVESLSLIHI